MLSAWLADTQRNPFSLKGRASRAVSSHTCVLCSSCVLTSAVHTGAGTCTPGSTHVCACVSPTGTLGTRGPNVVPRFSDMHGGVSVLWVVEQSQAHIATHLCTRSTEGMWAPGEQP